MGWEEEREEMMNGEGPDKHIFLTFSEADTIVLALETLQRTQKELAEELMYDRGNPDSAFLCTDSRRVTEKLLDRFLTEFEYDEYES